MSKKKNKKVELKLVEPNTEIKEEIPALPIPEPPELTKEQQLASMLFNDLFTKTLNITESFENEHLMITVFQKKDSDEIESYEVISKSNEDVSFYVASDAIMVCLKDKVLDMKTDELIYSASNILDYVKKYYMPKAA